nr:MAG TPA: hypothetical protein [Caudoviricetes sp.]
MRSLDFINPTEVILNCIQTFRAFALFVEI